MGYLCANFGLLRPLCSRLWPDVCDRQTDVRCQTKASLNAPPIGGGGITSCARGDTICPRPSPPLWAPSTSRAAEQTQRSSSSHAQYVLTVTAAPASRVEAAVSKRPGHLLTVKVVSESRMTLATSVPILVFLGLSVLELFTMYATDRQTSDKSIA